MGLSQQFTGNDGPHFAAYYRWLVLTRHANLEIKADAILDVGCDDGYLLSQQAGHLKVGVDLEARPPAHPSVKLVRADGCSLPFVSGSFDAVLAIDVIEHVKDDQAFIESITRVLAPGGRLWLTTPAAQARLFPSFLTDRAMGGWGHQRMGHDARHLMSRIPGELRVQVTLWNATVFRHAYLPLRALRVVSPMLARLGARLCFELDRRLPAGRDYIVLKITAKNPRQVQSG